MGCISTRERNWAGMVVNMEGKEVGTCTCASLKRAPEAFLIPNPSRTPGVAGCM